MRQSEGMVMRTLSKLAAPPGRSAAPVPPAVSRSGVCRLISATWRGAYPLDTFSMTIKSTPNKTSKVYAVRNLAPADEKGIVGFLRNVVDDWCRNSSGAWFGLRDLMGGANKDWGGTPLQVLYDRHAATSPPDKALKKAAVDGGRLLKQVLDRDTRFFEAEKGYRTAVYRLIP